MKGQLELKELSNDQSFSSCYEHESSSVMWMSSKMRIMRKFVCSEQKTVRRIRRRRRRCQQIQDDQRKEGNKDQSSCESSNNGGINRVCSDCSTTKTPLWRSGPLGPKSLCNACGIKQMKARKAMSSAAQSSKLQYPVVPIKPEKNQSSKVDCSIPFKKRCRFVATAEAAQRKLSFEDMPVALKERLVALKGVFPQDEKDAAILLMALAHRDS
ncbi:putative GATA transcription factor 22 [Phalaenopsis equestris]|uniref:putative GATA transcription factor 22 n=1 Tax=Phalaenopsis equestris TaxID=78828 RepID=UPI0009E2B78C|nr:putative GATA transcription factor 22 [Phalaenopsis equestris]